MNKVPRNIFGCGLVALDLILGEGDSVPTKSNALAGGSCGNVLTILAYLGWDTYPIAQLSNNSASKLLLHDMIRWNVNTEYLSISEKGITPVIIHRIYKDKPKHRFEFKNPQTNAWLPRYKPVTKKYVSSVLNRFPQGSVFYFDRTSSATLSLASKSRNDGAIIVFEPSSIKDTILFEKALSLSHIVKFSNERIPMYKELYPVSQSEIEIQTLGLDGVMYRTKDSDNRWHTLYPYSVNKVLDTAGAGDWCTAGIIHSILMNEISLSEFSSEDIEKAINVGQSMGAINCCFTGARGSMYNISADHFKKLVTDLIKDGYMENVQDFSDAKEESSNQSSYINYDELLYIN